MLKLRLIHQLIIFFILLFSLVNPAYCMTEEEFSSWAKNDKEFLMYMKGLVSGYIMANVKLEEKARTKLFCQPAKLILGDDTYINMLAKHSQDFGKDGQKNVALFNIYLINSLIETFPCEQNVKAQTIQPED